MNTDYEIISKIEDLTNLRISTLTSYSVLQLQGVLSNASKDVIRKLRMINPELLWHFSKELSFYQKNSNITVHIGTGSPTGSEHTGEGNIGLLDLGRTFDGAYANNITTFTMDDTVSNLDAGDYFTFGTNLTSHPESYEICQAQTVVGTAIAAQRGLFNTKRKAVVDGDKLIKITYMTEILDLLSVRRRVYYNEGSYTDGDLLYQDDEATYVSGNKKHMLERKHNSHNSFFRASKTAPVYAHNDSKLTVYPKILGSEYRVGSALSEGDERVIVDAVCVPWSGLTPLPTDTFLYGMPSEYQDLIILWAAIEYLRLKILDDKATLVSLETTVVPQSPTLSTMATALPTYSFTEVFNMPSAASISTLNAFAGATAPTYTPAVMDTIADPLVGTLTVTANLPASLGDLSLSSVTPSASLPTVNDIVMSPVASLSLDASPTYNAINLPSVPSLSISIVDISNFNQVAGIQLPTDLSIGAEPGPASAPTITDISLPASPEMTAMTKTLPTTTNLNSVSANLPVLDIGVPDALSALASFPTMPTKPGLPDKAYSGVDSTPGAPTSAQFPAPPAVPQMESLPSAPTIETDFGDVTHTPGAVQVFAGSISEPTLGTVPSFDDYQIDQKFIASWSVADDNAMTGSSVLSGPTTVTDWGHILNDEDGDLSAKTWSFEHAMQVEEDPEVAELRLKQMAVEVDKWKAKNEVLARAFEAEMNGYSEGIRAQVAKIQGEAEIAGASAKTAIATVEADKAIIEGQVASIQGKAQAQKAKSDAYLAEVNAKVASFEGQASAITKIYVAQVQGLAQQYATESDYLVNKFTASTQAQLGLFQANMQKEIQLYTQEIASWSKEVESIVNRWAISEWRTKVEKWQVENQLKISEYQSKLGGIIQKYSQDIAKENNIAQIDVANYGAEFSSVNGEYNSNLQKYQAQVGAEIQKYVSERDYEMSAWKDKEAMEIQAYSARHQMMIQDYTAKVSAYVQRYQSDLASSSAISQADIAQYGARLQKESTELSSRLQSYAAESGNILSKTQQENTFKYQDWVNTQNNKIQKYQTEVQENIALFQANLQEEQARFANELGKYRAELEMKIADNVNRPSGEFQANIAKYQAGLQEYGANVQKQLQQFTTNASNTLNIWVTNKQSSLQEYQGRIQTQGTKLQNDMQIYMSLLQTNVQEFSAQSSIDVQNFGANVQGEVQRFSALLQKSVTDYQAGLQKYQTEWAKVSQGNQILLGKYSSELQGFQLEAGEKAQRHQANLQDVSSKTQINLQTIEELKSRYERGFIPYQQQTNQQQGG